MSFYFASKQVMFENSCMALQKLGLAIQINNKVLEHLKKMFSSSDLHFFFCCSRFYEDHYVFAFIISKDVEGCLSFCCYFTFIWEKKSETVMAKPQFLLLWLCPRRRFPRPWRCWDAGAAARGDR